MDDIAINYDSENKQRVEKCQALEAENAMLHLKCATLIGKLKSQSEKVIYLSNKVEDALKEKNQWKKSVLKLQENIGDLQSEYNNLKATVDTMPVQVQEHCNLVLEMVGTRTAAVAQAQGEVDALHESLIEKERQLLVISDKLQQEKQRRKCLHNTVMELRGNIRVHCRVRPVMEVDRKRGNFDTSQGTSMAFVDQVVHVADEETVLIKTRKMSRGFEFEKVYRPSTSQTAMFEEVQPLITSVLDGYNVCVMAYGQTGSGKTHTMLGKHEKDNYNISTSETRPDEGIVPRAVQDLFRLVNEKPMGMHTVEISVVEIYNNEIQDLLSHDIEGAAKPARHEIVMAADGTMCLPSVTSWPADTAVNAMKWVREGLKARCVSETLIHEHSSRSHLIIILTITTEPGLERVSPSPVSSPKRRTNHSRDCLSPSSPTKRSRSQIPRYGALKPRSRSPSPLRASMPQKSSPFTQSAIKTKLQLVDLAGSECIGASGSSGVQLREASFINKSLCALADVLSALSENRSHIPYRNSKLTHLLQDSIGGDAKLMIYVCVSPTRLQLGETVQTLAFGQRARQVQRGEVRKRASSAPTAYHTKQGKGEACSSPKLTRARSSSMKTLTY